MACGATENMARKVELPKAKFIKWDESYKASARGNLSCP